MILRLERNTNGMHGLMASRSRKRLQRIVLASTTPILLLLLPSHLEASKPYSYQEFDTEDGIGWANWETVQPDQFHHDWQEINDAGLLNFDGNECEDTRVKLKHKQSPIQLSYGEGMCVEDNHRMNSFTNGNCKWHDMIFKITPHELRMDYPMALNPANNKTDPFEFPCKKPKLDISGGYKNAFRTVMMSLKVPAEHITPGLCGPDKEQCDGEITIGHLGQLKTAKKLMYNAIVIDANETYKDNPILAPYLHKWEKIHNSTLKSCQQRFGYNESLGFIPPEMPSPTAQPTAMPSGTPQPTPSPTVSSMPSVSSPPSVAPSAAPSQLCTDNNRRLAVGDFRDTGGSSTEMKGVFFDVDKVDKSIDVTITGLDLNIKKTMTRTVQIYARYGTHVGYEFDEDAWMDVGEYTVAGQGRRRPTFVSFDADKYVALPPMTSKVAFYVLHVDDDDIQTSEQRIAIGMPGRGHPLASDRNLKVLVGTGKEDTKHAFVGGETVEGLGFSGRIYYTACETIEGWSPTLFAGPQNGRTMNPFDGCTREPRKLTTTFKRWGNEEDMERTERQGIMFDIDVLHGIEKGVIVSGLDLNVERRNKAITVQVYTRVGSHIGHDKDDFGWEDLGLYNITSRGQDKATRLDFWLQRQIYVPPGKRQAFFVLQIGDDNIQTYDVANWPTQQHHAVKDDFIRIHMGTGKDGEEFTSLSTRHLGFSGTVRYSICGNEMLSRRNLRRVSNEAQETVPARGSERQLDEIRSEDSQVSEFPEFDIYRLHTSPYYWRYRGSMTMPPCTETVRWRVLDKALKISQRQLDLIHKLLREYRDKDSCELSTMAEIEPGKGENKKVNVARPVQNTTEEHEVIHCNENHFGSSGFYKTPRGNTGWNMIPSGEWQFYFDPSNHKP